MPTFEELSQHGMDLAAMNSISLKYRPQFELYITGYSLSLPTPAACLWGLELCSSFLDDLKEAGLAAKGSIMYEEGRLEGNPFALFSKASELSNRDAVAYREVKEGSRKFGGKEYEELSQGMKDQFEEIVGMLSDEEEETYANASSLRGDLREVDSSAKKVKDWEDDVDT